MKPRKPISEFLHGHAARMRDDPTEAEAHLWPYLKELGFFRQWVIEGRTKNGGHWQHILDFYYSAKNLNIEVDGPYHKRTKGHDRRRDTRLRGDGITVLRFTNERVLTDVDSVVVEITKAMR